MPNYSNSPLGLNDLSSGPDSTTGLTRYVMGTSSYYKSIFRDPANTYSPFGFNPNLGDIEKDISTLKLVDYTKDINSMRLKYSDFAYLKNLGVYPNNRLIIARRFPAPIGDDLTSTDGGLGPKDIFPISTLISWVPDNENFITTDFGEKWTEGEASFRDILNDLGHDVLMGDNSGKNLGDAVASGANGVSLPGFTEGLQYQVFKSLGLSDVEASQLPYGNPNLIRQSRRRETAGKDKSFSGLKGKFKVKMSVEYEQKFISGIDPTIVYYDIIANALAFGTSDANFQFTSSVGSKFKTFIDQMSSGNSHQIRTALLDFISVISSSLQKVAVAIYQKITQLKNTKALKDEAKALSDLNKITTTIITGLVNKYKIRILSVVNALTGTPSGPWHVTVGNPRRPIFSSGDMIVEDVTITMGKILAFNDLPSSIKIDFTLESARNLGSQEIMKKFSCGKERSYIRNSINFVDTNLEKITDTEIKESKNRIQMRDIASAKLNVPSGGDVNSGDVSTQGINLAKQIYPSSLINIPGSSVIIGDPTKNDDGSTDWKVAPIVPIAELGNQKLQFWPDGRVYAQNNGNWTNQVGNWTVSGKDTILTLNGTRGIPAKPITIVGK